RPYSRWLPPEDRLWRHPSEMASNPSSHPAVGGLGVGSVAARLAPDGRTARTWMVAVLAGLIGALTASGIGMVTGVFQHSSTAILPVIPPTLTVSMAPPPPGTTVDWHAIDNKIAPSVVGVSVSGANGQQGSGLLMIDGQGVDYVVTDRSLFAADYDTGSVGGI